MRPDEWQPRCIAPSFSLHLVCYADVTRFGHSANNERLQYMVLNGAHPQVPLVLFGNTSKTEAI